MRVFENRIGTGPNFSCGKYSRVQDIQSACDADEKCKGFTFNSVKKPLCMYDTKDYAAHEGRDYTFFQKQ